MFCEASIRTDFCIPDSPGEYYFEIDVLNYDTRGYKHIFFHILVLFLTQTSCVAVGFSDYSTCIYRRDLVTLPGWDCMSWGYHSDDGRKFNRDSFEDGQGQEYADTFTTGDTIGCGVDFKSHTAYFTKNGIFLGWMRYAIIGKLLTCTRNRLH